tara:strand:- start:85 stop:891 length:807 start_codon:yes stop_codon:yes gene_type:complete
MIVCKKLSKSFDNKKIIKHISLTIRKGERVSLIGPGGSGKSTLLKIILGLLKPEKGSSTLLGVNLSQASLEDQNRIYKKCGMAFQQGGLFDFMTIEENLLFAMKHMTKKTKDEMVVRVGELLNSVKLPETNHLYPHELSGGMKRRVGIIRALCTDPEVAIFDEPTSGLDPVTSTVILNMIQSLADNSMGTSLLVATTNVEIAFRFAERILILHEGRIIADGYWKELLVEGSTWVKNFLGIRLIGLDISYARELCLPEKFINKHWGSLK